MTCLLDRGRPEVAPSLDLRNPQEAGWYLARPWPISCSDEAPVVVRVTPDPAGVTTVWRIGSRDPQTLDQWRLCGKIHIGGAVTDLDLKEAHEAGRKQGHRDATLAQAAYEAAREREHPEYTAGIRLDLTEKGKGVIAIRIPLAHADGLQERLSGVLCWAAGFNAALPPYDTDRSPLGVDAIRDINIALKSALERAEEGRKSHGR